MQARFKGVHAKRHPLWGPSQFLADLERYGSVKKVCEIYAVKGCAWRGLYNDYWRWRRDDPEFAMAVDKLVKKGGKGGRPKKDGGDISWQEEYCRVLVENNGNEEKARAVTPYSSRQISEFLSKTSTSYDASFSEKVEDAWEKIGAPNQEVVFGTIHELNKLDIDKEESFYKAKTLETIHRVATKTVEKWKPTKFGNRLNVDGRVDHVHSQERYLPQGEIVARLIEDRQRFLDNRQRMAEERLLPENAGGAEIIDVEEIDGPSSSS